MVKVKSAGSPPVMALADSPGVTAELEAHWRALIRSPATICSVSHVDELIDLLEHRVGVVAGRGPAHPTHPNPELRPELDQFLADYPSIRGNAEYVQFLERYAGAYGENADASRIVDVFGFDGTATGIVDSDGPVVTADGYLIFAQCVSSEISDGKLVDSTEQDFAFSVTSPGVYLASSTLRAPEQSFAWYADNFGQWARKLAGAA